MGGFGFFPVLFGYLKIPPTKHHPNSMCSWIRTRRADYPKRLHQAPLPPKRGKKGPWICHSPRTPRTDLIQHCAPPWNICQLLKQQDLCRLHTISSTLQCPRGRILPIHVAQTRRYHRLPTWNWLTRLSGGLVEEEWRIKLP